MRIAAIYDIHANLPALEAVLAEIHEIGVDHVVVGGDVVPGPMPRATMAALLELRLPTHFIRGNGEQDTLAMLAGTDVDTVPEQARQVCRWAGETLSPAHVRLMQGWPPTVRFAVPGLGDVLFCHATPQSDRHIFTALTPEERLLPIFHGTAAAVVVCGHTHMQFDRSIGETRVVNAGSVGMPFGETGAYWLLLGPEIELRRTAYDIAAAAQRIRASDYPYAGDFAARNVERPPSASAMLEIFERGAVQ